MYRKLIHRKLILASASPRRRELLAQVGADFIVLPAAGEERITKEQPQEAVMELALQKAMEVAERIAKGGVPQMDRKHTRLNSSNTMISYAVFYLKKT